jgi:hypothetical protein
MPPAPQDQIMGSSKTINCTWSDLETNLGNYIKAADEAKVAKEALSAADAANPGPSMEKMTEIEANVEAEIKKVPRCYVDFGPESDEYKARIREIRAPLAAIETRLHVLREAGKVVEEAKAKEAKAKAAMSPDLQALPLADLRGLCSDPIDLAYITEGYDYTLAERAAVVRGEVKHECGCDKGFGYAAGPWRDTTVMVRMDDEVRHGLCHHLATHGTSTPECLTDLVPKRFQKHRAHALTPRKLNPIPAETQAQQIASIPSSEEGLNGWLMLGEGGTSKTTYAAAAFTDMLTLRCHKLLDQPRKSWRNETRMCAWAITVPEWLSETEKYKYRNYKSEERIDAPKVTAEAICKEAKETGLRPILWIEEIDKLKMTEPRRILLFELINCVYKLDGLIICTSNMTLADLRAHLDTSEYPITRRIAGDKDAEGYRIWDFWPPQQLKKAISKKKVAA